MLRVTFLSPTLKSEITMSLWCSSRMTRSFRLEAENSCFISPDNSNRFVYEIICTVYSQLATISAPDFSQGIGRTGKEAFL
jgi:hypothetical protein